MDASTTDVAQHGSTPGAQSPREPRGGVRHLHGDRGRSPSHGRRRTRAHRLPRGQRHRLPGHVPRCHRDPAALLGGPHGDEPLPAQGRIVLRVRDPPGSVAHPGSPPPTSRSSATRPCRSRCSPTWARRSARASSSSAAPEIPWWLLTLASVALVGALGYRQIELSSRVLVVVLLAEIGHRRAAGGSSSSSPAVRRV